MKKEFIVERNGKSFVLYAGLLDAAHERGLKEIVTTLVQIPSTLNDEVAIVHASVTTEQGTFTGLGDASPANVSRMMTPHTIRMAETRAKARALRDAVNVGVTALEELGDDDAGGDAGDYEEAAEREHRARVVASLPVEDGRAAAASIPAPQVERARRVFANAERTAGVRGGAPQRLGEVLNADSPDGPPSAQQLANLEKLAVSLERDVPANLSRKRAGALLVQWSDEWNARKRGKSNGR